jgi:hypothetical protein
LKCEYYSLEIIQYFMSTVRLLNFQIYKYNFFYLYLYSQFININFSNMQSYFFIFYYIFFNCNFLDIFQVSNIKNIENDKFDF